MIHELLDLIDRYWKFDDDQTPVSNWHDKQDLLEVLTLKIKYMKCTMQLIGIRLRNIMSAFADILGQINCRQRFRAWRSG